MEANYFSSLSWFGWAAVAFLWLIGYRIFLWSSSLVLGEWWTVQPIPVSLVIVSLGIYGLATWLVRRELGRLLLALLLFISPTSPASGDDGFEPQEAADSPDGGSSSNEY